KFANDQGLLLVTFLWSYPDGAKGSYPDGGPTRTGVLPGRGNGISSVLLQGGPTAPGPKWLTRLADTDVSFRTEPVPQDPRSTYGHEAPTKQNIPREVAAVPDPLNKSKFNGRSFVELPSAPPQKWIQRLPGVPEGKIALFKIQSAYLSAER